MHTNEQLIKIDAISRGISVCSLPVLGWNSLARETQFSHLAKLELFIVLNAVCQRAILFNKFVIRTHIQLTPGLHPSQSGVIDRASGGPAAQKGPFYVHPAHIPGCLPARAILLHTPCTLIPLSEGPSFLPLLWFRFQAQVHRQTTTGSKCKTLLHQSDIFN